LVREKATPAALQGLGQGCALFLFQGHGSTRLLAPQGVLQADDMDALDNQGRSPLAVFVTCFAGAFDDPECEAGQCIAERLLNAPSGAIACIAPTRLGGLNIDFPLLGRLLTAPRTPLGEALAIAKQSILGRRQDHWEAIENYNLLGDPLLVLNLQVQPPPPPPGQPGLPVEDPLADDNGNRIADSLERHAADGLYQRFGPPGDERLAAFCALAQPPTKREVEAIEQLGGHVLDISGPPWAMEIALPILNVTPVVQALPNLLLIKESTRWGIRSRDVLRASPAREP
jgi:hypothetical protein